MSAVHVHNQSLRQLIRDQYKKNDVQLLRQSLDEHGVFRMSALPSGLFAAAHVSAETVHTGYHNVWVRDNVYVAHAHRAVGRYDVAARTVVALLAHFRRQLPRLRAVIKNPQIADNPQQRPHVKFDGINMADLSGEWSHAQNDALGLFLWLYAEMAATGQVPLGTNEAEVITALVEYFRAIRFNTDEDSGHWEEDRRILASSVGAVLAGLSAIERLMRQPVGNLLAATKVDDLILAARLHLAKTLPAECIDPDPAKNRLADAATLFLIYPLRVVDDYTADRILNVIHTQLQGEFGIRRYLGDSFWCDDYSRLVDAASRTKDYSNSIADRNRLLTPGGEAQWCIFDPIVSIIYGRRYRADGNPDNLARQTFHFNRSVGQVTGAHAQVGFDDPITGRRAVKLGGYLCPELYHYERMADGRLEIQPSEATPLLWAQANMMVAIEEMDRSCSD